MEVSCLRKKSLLFLLFITFANTSTAGHWKKLVRPLSGWKATVAGACTGYFLEQQEKKKLVANILSKIEEGEKSGELIDITEKIKSQIELPDRIKVFKNSSLKPGSTMLDVLDNVGAFCLPGQRVILISKFLDPSSNLGIVALKHEVGHVIAQEKLPGSITQKVGPYTIRGLYVTSAAARFFTRSKPLATSLFGIKRTLFRVPASLFIFSLGTSASDYTTKAIIHRNEFKADQNIIKGTCTNAQKQQRIAAFEKALLKIDAQSDLYFQEHQDINTQIFLKPKIEALHPRGKTRIDALRKGLEKQNKK